MLKARSDNTLADGKQRVYVDGASIKWYSGLTSWVLKAFRRGDTADAAMAHVWSKAASSKNGMTRAQILKEIDSIKEE